MNFDALKPGYEYSRTQSPSMPSLQTEGVAYLCNLLARRRVALLADEVGMGKTLQALGVAAMLWQRKPSARILVMAPNRDICMHWENELNALVRDHYRKTDGVVMSAQGGLVPQVEAHYRLRDLQEAIGRDTDDQTRGKLYLTTIYSLSGLVVGMDDADGPITEKRRLAARAGRDLNDRIRRSLGGHGFDLLILDEAHYFRNRDGGSQRVAAAKTFFGGDGSRIAKHALLLTATPSHTQLSDIASILDYFREADDDAAADPASLMQRYALRRFRRMAGKDGGFTRHQYRREIATSSSYSSNPEDEMFFALYQRNLVHGGGEAATETRRMLYGYLEGFESAGNDDRDTKPTAEDGEAQQNEDGAKDFHGAADTLLLRRMSEEFRGLMKRAPGHPKYGSLVAQCSPLGLFPMDRARPLYEDKHLVFVRRIPSVREITKRINERYDEILAEHIRQVWGWDDAVFARWRHSSWSRDVFNEIVAPADHAVTGPSGVPDAADNPDAEADADADVDTVGDAVGDGTEPDREDVYLRSRIADLFVTKKTAVGEAAPKSTDCSRFSLALRRPNSMFAMFMEPASDYTAGAYDWHYQSARSEKPRPDYVGAAQARRMSGRTASGAADAPTPEPSGPPREGYDEPVGTMWTIVFEHLSEPGRAKLRGWAEERPDVAENFGNYVKAGFLFASPVVIELYGWYVEVRRSQTVVDRQATAQARYRAFFDFARGRIENSLLLRYFEAALESFEQLCGKIIGHDAGDRGRSWRSLTTLSSPAWYACGGSGHRQHLILGFNSPFYPNTLVATSVFQEGVNLHLQCRKVHHYGIAWTPGDNEQRVGRIDRLFGRVNGMLRDPGPEGVTLDINYPYLADSFDEDQVGSFVERKHAVEEKMDRCLQGSFDKEVRMSRTNWHEFLRQPVADHHADDPYPAPFRGSLP